MVVPLFMEHPARQDARPAPLRARASWHSGFGGDMGALSGKTAIISGAAGGIGGAIAALFAREGARVACVDLAPPTATVAAIQGAGGQAMALTADVSREADTLAAVQAVVAAWGPVHVLVNGASPDDPTGTILDLAPQDWDRVFAVHVTGAYLMSRAALPNRIAWTISVRGSPAIGSTP